MEQKTEIKQKNVVAFHFRSTKKYETGGVTVVYNPKTKRFGYAICQNGDHFEKSEGFVRALGRSKSSVRGIQRDVDSFEDIRKNAIEIAKMVKERFNEHAKFLIQREVEYMEREMLLEISFDKQQ